MSLPDTFPLPNVIKASIGALYAHMRMLGYEVVWSKSNRLDRWISLYFTKTNNTINSNDEEIHNALTNRIKRFNGSSNRSQMSYSELEHRGEDVIVTVCIPEHM